MADSVNPNPPNPEEPFNKALNLVLDKINRHEGELKAAKKKPVHKNVYMQGLVTFIISVSTILITARLDLLKQVESSGSRHTSEVLTEATSIRKDQAEKINNLEKSVTQLRDKYYESLEKYNTTYLLVETLKQEVQQLKLKIDSLQKQLDEANKGK